MWGASYKSDEVYIGSLAVDKRFYTRLEDPRQSTPKQGTDMDYHRKPRIDHSDRRRPVEISYILQYGRGTYGTFLFNRGLSAIPGVKRKLEHSTLEKSVEFSAGTNISASKKN